MDITTPTPAAPHNEWQVVADGLLSRLEEISSDLLGRLDSSADTFASPDGIGALIEERGVLIHQLAKHMDGATATYVEWNRMVVIQDAGGRIGAGLREARRQLMSQASVSGRDRAFLDCVNGVFTAPDTSENIMA
jgi:hypothetical protein